MRADALGLFWEDKPKIPKAAKKEKFLPPEDNWSNGENLPYLKEALSFNIPLMTDEDLISAWENKHQLSYDIECYINYVLIGFKDMVTNKVIYFERFGDDGWNQDLSKLSWIMHNMTTVGFNSDEFDNTLCAIALSGKENQVLKSATNMMIGENYRGYQVLRSLRIKKLRVDHIDLKEVAPVSGSLKIYGGRAGTKRMQDLPVHEATELTREQAAVVRYYWVNDLNLNIDLKNCLIKEMKLRENMSQEYGLDLRSKSDAQIAEAVISSEIKKLTGVIPTKPIIEPGTAYRYTPPSWLKFKTRLMDSVLDVVTNTLFVVGESGSITTPPELANLKFTVGSSTYKLGIGGLHSREKKATHVSDELYQLQDDDVESYYPRIILNMGYFPKHLGRIFLQVFDTIVTRRLDAKHKAAKYAKEGNKKLADDYKAITDSLKIVINGTFGKLGSMHSLFYSPDLLIHVTLTGQLALLMLAESLELAGIQVVSGNTDGIVSKCPRNLLSVKENILNEWQAITNFKMEGNKYNILSSRDVNNYFAVKGNGSVKAKGSYADPGLSKNPTTRICSIAVEKFLANGVPLEETIKACTDPYMFCTVRTVKGGAVACKYKVDVAGVNKTYDEMAEHLRITGWVTLNTDHTWVRKSWVNSEPNYEKMALATSVAYSQAKYMPVDYEYLGKAVRWYYAKHEEDEHLRFVYAASGNLVPKSIGAKPLMEMDDELPSDLDYNWYVGESEAILKLIGYTE